MLSTPEMWKSVNLLVLIRLIVSNFVDETNGVQTQYFNKLMFKRN